MKTIVMGEPPVLDYSGQESLNLISTNLSFLGKDMKRLLVTSCVAAEGKTTMALRIAQNVGSRGRKVLLIDGDLRRSHLTEMRKLSTDGDMLGLVHYLAGYCEAEDALYQVQGMNNVDLIPAGRSVVNAIQLLDNPLFGQMMNRFAEAYDMILVDTPPIGLVVDAAEIAKCCDGAILVTEYGKRHRSELQAAVEQIKQAGCPVIGCILDKVAAKSGSQKRYYKNHYYYGYYSKYNNYYKNDKQ